MDLSKLKKWLTGKKHEELPEDLRQTMTPEELEAVMDDANSPGDQLPSTKADPIDAPANVAGQADKGIDALLAERDQRLIETMGKAIAAATGNLKGLEQTVQSLKRASFEQDFRARLTGMSSRLAPNAERVLQLENIGENPLNQWQLVGDEWRLPEPKGFTGEIPADGFTLNQYFDRLPTSNKELFVQKGDAAEGDGGKSKIEITPTTTRKELIESGDVIEFMRQAHEQGQDPGEALRKLKAN